MQNYNGGNKQPSEAATMAADLKTIRQSIFESPSGTIQSERRTRDRSCALTLTLDYAGVEELATDQGDYGECTSRPPHEHPGAEDS